MTPLLVVVGLALGQVPPVDEAALPAYWHGTWAGTLKVIPEKGDPHEMPMSLEIRPLADAARYTFRITYGEPGKGQVRDYELVPKKDKPGRFEIDEKNGIKVDARLNGAALHALFRVGGALIQSRYERIGDVLRVEMTAYDTAAPKVTKPTRGGMEVKSFPPLSVQFGELKRVPDAE